MAGQLKIGGNIIATHAGSEGAGTVTLDSSTLTIGSNTTVQGQVQYSALPAGTVVQVKSTIYNASDGNTGSASYVPTGLTVAITPKFSNSLMIIFWESGVSHWNATNGNSQGAFAVYNGSTLVTGSEKRFFWNTTGTANHYGYINVSSHTSETLSSGSAITYQLYAKATGGTFYYFNGTPGTYRPTMTVFEVKQ